MYNEMNASHKDMSMSYAGVMKDQDDGKMSISNGDKLHLLRNLRFIKDEQAQLFDAYKNQAQKKNQFEYGNTNMLDFKQNLRQDFQSFKDHIAREQHDMKNQQQALHLQQIDNGNIQMATDFGQNKNDGG